MDIHISLLALPEEILIEICQFLELDDSLLHFGSACSRFREIASHEVVWRHAFQRLLRPPPEFSECDAFSLHDYTDEVLERVCSLFGDDWSSAFRLFGSSFSEAVLWMSLSRVCYEVQSSDYDGEDGLKDSKIGGLPFLPRESDWPTCACCNRPMVFWFQYNTSSDSSSPVASRLGSDSLLQFFCCLRIETDDPYCPTWNTQDSSASLVRLIRDISTLEPRPRPYVQSLASQTNSHFPTHRISLTPRLDFPSLCGDNHTFVRSLLESYYGDGEDTLYDLEIENRDTDTEVDKGCYSEEKFFGWAECPQSDPHPPCVRCGRRMTLVFQIGACGRFPFMFGDCGIGYLFGCEAEGCEDVEWLFGWDGS